MLWRWMRYYRSAAGSCRDGSGWKRRSHTDSVDPPRLSSRSALVALRCRHADRAARPASCCCTAVAIRVDGAAPRSECRLRARCCHRRGGSSATTRDHDDNPFRSCLGRAEDRHDRQGRGCPGVVPGGPRFCLRCAEFLGLFPCTGGLLAKISCYRQNKLCCATTTHACKFRFGRRGGIFRASNQPHNQKGSLYRARDHVERKEEGKIPAQDSGSVPFSRHPAISHPRVSPVSSTSPRVPRCRLWPIAQSFRRPRCRCCYASP